MGADKDGFCQFGWWPPVERKHPTTTSRTTSSRTTTSRTTSRRTTTSRTTSYTSRTEPPTTATTSTSTTKAHGNLQRLSPWWQQVLQLSTMPASMLPAYAMALCSALSVAAAVALQRHRRGSAVSVTSPSASAVESASGDYIEETCYEPLASAPLSCGGEGNIDNTRGRSALR